MCAKMRSILLLHSKTEITVSKIALSDIINDIRLKMNSEIFFAVKIMKASNIGAIGVTAKWAADSPDGRRKAKSNRKPRYRRKLDRRLNNTKRRVILHTSQ